MEIYQPSILIIGYGNPGRLDDGLGPAFASVVESWNLPNMTVEAGYQLSIEDAHLASIYDFAIFADAAVTAMKDYYFRELVPKFSSAYTSHHLSPANVLGIAHSLFDSKVRGFELGIRGFEFNEFGERLSDEARNNLDAAIEFLEPFLKYERSKIPQITKTFEPTAN